MRLSVGGALVLALCAACARAQPTQACIKDLSQLSTCAGSLSGSSLGAACCPQIQALFNDCYGIPGLHTNVLGVHAYEEYWDLVLRALSVKGCPGTPSIPSPTCRRVLCSNAVLDGHLGQHYCILIVLIVRLKKALRQPS